MVTKVNGKIKGKPKEEQEKAHFCWSKDGPLFFTSRYGFGGHLAETAP